MLPKEERRAMLLRLFKDESPLIDHSQQNARQAPVSSTTTNPSTTNEQETIVDSDGGVALNTDIVDADAEVTAKPGASVAEGTEQDAEMTEDLLRAGQQSVVDSEQAVAAAPEREGEGDEMNTTV